DFLQRFAGFRLRMGPGSDVAERQYAHQVLVVGHDRHAPDLRVTHLRGNFLDGLVLETPFRVLAHHVLELRLVDDAALGNPSQHDVAIRHHADELAAVADRNDADVQFLHRLGGLHYGLVGGQGTDVPTHYLGNLCHVELHGVYGQSTRPAMTVPSCMRR